MLDIAWIRDNPEALDAALADRGAEPAAARIVALDGRVRAAKTRFQETQARRNEASRRIGQAKHKGEDPAPILAEVARLKDEARQAEDDERRASTELDALLATVPNVPDGAVPVGSRYDDGRELRRWGTPRDHPFAAKEHFELGEALGWMDFDRAAKLAGARFTVLSGPLARLERALAQFMLDVHTREFGYEEVSPPLLVREATAYGTGNLPKFADDLFHTTNDYWLIPTAEMPLTNLVAGEIVDEDRLPLRFTAWTPCFRSEAGAAGRDTRGMLRQHQFYKVELVSIATPEQSDAEHERMTACAEEVLKRLGLPYRVFLLPTGDMGFAARKTYDLEVWLPGQGAYREISSCSNCGDFQARRMKARCRAKGHKGTRFVHSLNGSGIAVGRAVIAVLENNQEADGTITVPQAVRPYMDGLERIEPRRG
ncbi:MAG: serine--tRNA ligase [Alphaproteobacteria bacterium]